jgi:hypothetical protein
VRHFLVLNWFSCLRADKRGSNGQICSGFGSQFHQRHLKYIRIRRKYGVLQNGKHHRKDGLDPIQLQRGAVAPNRWSDKCLYFNQDRGAMPSNPAKTRASRNVFLTLR